MDHLFYDLVEEVVSYLPRKDVNTIAKVAAKSQRLEKWSAAAEDQLENRFLLDVYVHFGRSKKKDAPKIYLSARRRIPDRGIDGYWNFRGWRYAWIRSVVVDATRVRYGLHYKYKPAEIDQVLRMVSLPVDPSIRTSLCCTATNDLAVKILLATQKGFATVEVSAESNHPDVFEDFAIDHLEHGVSLQKLTSYKGENICAAVAPLFRERRGKPLNIQLLGRHLDRWDMELIIDNWLQSDGTYEEKRLRYQSNFTQTKFTSWCKRRGIVTFAFGGYLAHPTRNSSLAITGETIAIVKFLPWHLPVSFKWIDSVIDNWKEGDSRYVYDRWRDFYFVFEDAGDWKKLAEKYEPAPDSNGRRIIIPYSSWRFAWFKLSVRGKYFHAQMTNSRSGAVYSSGYGNWRSRSFFYNTRVCRF